MSRTPVREAIRQLAASGLVEARAHRGAVVARPREERLTGMFEAMAELEALCAGLAAERMTGAERRALEAVHEELRALIHAGDPQRFHEVNEAFHSAIYAGSHNAYLAEMTLATRARVQPFRRAQFRNLGRLAKSHVEHDRVVVAILRGDRERAAAAMRAHIDDGARGIRGLRRIAVACTPRCLACAPRTRASRRSSEMSRAPAIAVGLDQKALHAAAVGEPHRADRQRRRHRGDEAAEAVGRQRPDFDLDRSARCRPRRAAARASAACVPAAHRAGSPARSWSPRASARRAPAIRR